MNKNKIVYNTKESGIFHFIVFKDKDDYTAVCLNLNIVEYGKNPEELKKSIQEAAFSHLGAIRKKNLPDKYLNIPAPKRYWDKLKEVWLEEEFSRETMTSKSRGKLSLRKNFTDFIFTRKPYPLGNFSVTA